MYFVTPGDHESLKLTCSDAAGNSNTTEADIKVDGPKKTIIPKVFPVGPYPINGQTIIGPVQTLVSTNMSILKKSEATAGVDIEVSPADDDNAFLWVQVLHRDVATRTHKDGTVENVSTVPSGINPDMPVLDVGGNSQSYIHSRGLRATDSPGIGVKKDTTGVNSDFKAETYLMWDCGKPGSIPAILESAAWGYTKKATVATNGGWTPDNVKGSTTTDVNSATSILDYPR